jgi:MFS family permease
MSSDSPAPTPAPRTGWASLKDLTGYQWFVFIVCCLAWDMDCMDQQLFALARRPAMESLVPKVTAEDPRFAQQQAEMSEKAGKPVPNEKVVASLRNADINSAAGLATSFFLAGWATGGIFFGILGDRWGRVKTLMLTIGMYAAFTGLSALSSSTADFHAYRFLTGLGVGGVFAAAVTLLAETVPPNARPFALGLFQASSVLGNCTAALIRMYLGSLEEAGKFADQTIFGFPMESWRLMFVVGILPGLLVVFIQFGLKEPEKWRLAMAAGGAKRAGSYGDLLGDSAWRNRAIFGLLLALSGVIGLWGIGFFSYDLQSYVAKPVYQQEAVEKGLMTEEQLKSGNIPDAANKYVNGQTAYWSSITSLMQNGGAFFGIFAFSWVTFAIGRKPAFALFFLLAGCATAAVFMFLNTRSDIFWMIPMMGFFQLALFGGYAIYFPELFPTRLRSTGTSFCYNVGRLISAGTPVLLGWLSGPMVFGTYAAPLPFRYAGAAMCAFFGLGLFALLFLPETKDKPLPE